MTRGEIWWASLRNPTGSEPGFKRPVLIIQSNIYNKSKINTVICVVITSNLKLSTAGKNILLKSSESSLPKDSVINTSQIVTIDKDYLDQPVGFVSSKVLHQLENSLRVVLGLC